MLRLNHKRVVPTVVLDKLTIVLIAFFILALAIVFRLFQLQIFNYKSYSEIANQQHLSIQTLVPQRGKILIHDLRDSQDVFYPVAVNRKYFLLYAVPSQVKNPVATLKALETVIELDEEKRDLYLEKLSKIDDIYEPLIRKLEPEQKKLIEALDLEGIRFEEETWRYYPEKNLTSNLTGFVGYQGDNLVGRYGIEGYWENELAGRAGEYIFEKDASGRLIPIAHRSKAEVVDGADIVLTVDRSIQFTACKILESWVIKSDADSGSVIVMDPKTGAILAMCNYPNYDPNNYGQVQDVAYYNNLSIANPYEPGSVFKAITMAMGLDLGKVDPLTTYEDKGVEKIAGYEIKNFDGKAHGTKTMTQVLEESLNTGVIYVSRLVTPKRFREYVKNFGFGQKTGINMSQEKPGNIDSLDKDKEIYMATASFGQGITVTPLQLVSAFSVIANKGKLMKPYLVEEVRYANGKIDKFKPQEVRQVILEKTATTLSAMLASVVKYGHAKTAAVDGYYIAGKTGTAQVAEGGKYLKEKTIHSFIGFAPVEDPRYVMLTKVNHARNIEWASSSAAPMFGEISQFLLNYFKVPPSY